MKYLEEKIESAKARIKELQMLIDEWKKQLDKK
jgi:FtsZ-binding cell division protein ZapB